MLVAGVTHCSCSEFKEWGPGGGGSGDGSDQAYTANVRQQILNIIRRYNISSMLDSSCGSMHWMPLVLEEAEKSQPGFRFVGTDVVCMLIDQHKQTFVNHTNWDFQVGARQLTVHAVSLFSMMIMQQAANTQLPAVHDGWSVTLKASKACQFAPNTK
jgi:hypothetical protein